MTVRGRWLAVLGLTACTGVAGDGDGKRMTMSKPPEECGSFRPIAFDISAGRARVGQPVLLTAMGGSGVYRFGVEPGGSGGEVRGDRFIAGPTPATDKLFVADGVCGGKKVGRTLEIVAAFSALPARGTIRPGTAFKIQVDGTLGEPAFNLAQNGSGGTLLPNGSYAAGAREGTDLVYVKDGATGDEALLQFTVTKSARFRGSPDRVAIPAGSVAPLATADGTDSAIWTKVSGPGAVAGEGAAARFIAEADATGVTELEGKDRFTGESTRLRVRILGELKRPVTAYGRLTDSATVATADFDGDGLTDVALGVPESDIGRPQGGAVFIFKATAMGFPAEPTWTIPGTSDTAQLGAVLAVGDLDGDGKADLAAASPGADVTVGDSGAVYLYKFGAKGPESLRNPLTALGRGSFGTGLDIADVDGDGIADVIVGAPGADLAPTATISRRGVVDVFFVKKGLGIPDVGNLRLGGWDLGVDGTIVAKAGLTAGRGVLAADLDGDLKIDLAVITSVSNSLLGGAALARTQTAVQVYFSRGGPMPYEEIPDLYVLPSDPADVADGTWRIAAVPGEGKRPPLLLLAADLADSPDLAAAGGKPAAVNAGGVLLFDLTKVKPAGAASRKPPQIGRANAYARFYGDTAGLAAGRSFVVADVDGTAGPELLMGGPLALPPGAGAGSTPPLGRILVFPLTSLTPGTVANVPLAERAGKAGDALGAGLGFVTTKAGGVLVAVNSRANTMQGKFTGRVDFLTAKKAALGEWASASAELPARAALTNFGVSVAVTVLAGKTVAAVGAPGASGVRAAMDGTDPGLGQTLVFDGANPAMPLLAMDGATSPLMRGGRALGTDVTFTDFNGDGRPDLVVGAPNLQVPAASARATEVAPFYAQESPGCIAAAVQGTGGVLISLGMADGTFKAAYRLWAAADITGCTPANAMDTKCRRSGIGRGVIGGFDFDGDGKQDVGALRSQGFEVFLGRAPADASLAKLTMVCDPVLSVPSVGQTTSAPAMVGDLDGDKCADVGFRYSADGTRGGFYVAFGFDAGGRCGATHAVPVGLRLSGDADAGLAPMGLGVAAARAGRFLDDGRDHVAISASRFLYQGIAQPAILFFDAAALAKRRPPMGELLVGAIEDGLAPVVLAPRERGTGFGQVLAGGFDLNGDGKPDLVVSAPGASFGSEGGGAVFIYGGGRPATAPEVLLTLAGDARERSNFGQSVAVYSGAGAVVPTLVVGAPTSYRTGTQNGTAFLLPLRY